MCFSLSNRLNTPHALGGALSRTRDRVKLAADLVSKGATILAEPCPQDGGIQVRFKGKVYCTTHDDLSSVSSSPEVSYEGVADHLKEVLLARLNDVTAALATEKDPEKLERLVSLAAKYFELLQKLPVK